MPERAEGQKGIHVVGHHGARTEHDARPAPLATVTRLPEVLRELHFVRGLSELDTVHSEGSGTRPVGG